MTPELRSGSVLCATTDAIVNAANSRLIHAGGLARAIADAAGPALWAECELIAEVPTGSAVATTAGNLAATWVIHAVGPVWEGGQRGESELLAGAYRSSLQVAVEIGARSIAFPSISTGIFGYPLELAAPVAIAAVREAWAEHADAIDAVAFYLYTQREYGVFVRAGAGSV
jgi:O-acetyl-ADP-ribose deacetylase (regulator of RNase III)